MTSLGELKHVVSSPDYCPNNIAFDSAAAATVLLAHIDGKRYRVSSHDNVNGVETGTESDTKIPLVSNAQAAVRGQVVQLEPTVQVNTTEAVAPLNIEMTRKEMSSEILEDAVRAHEAIDKDQDSIAKWASTVPEKDVEITTLGTGSALPSKYRNVSATLLRVPGWGSMLFDAGENTLGQLKRAFTPEEFEELITGLRLIVISHMHADHHLGTVGVIKSWYEKVHRSQPASTPLPTAPVQDQFHDGKRLAVISEPAMASWLEEYSAVEDYGYSRIAPLNVSPAFPDHGQTSRLNWFVRQGTLNGLSSQARKDKFESTMIPPSLLGLKDVQACLVKHCHGARAISITWPTGFKASYSGDCRPSQAFSQIGKGSTVCIHEATFDDELQGDAEAKNHSTTSEALGVAQAMGAKACVLTHFSQRYQKLPVLEHASEDEPTVEDTLTAQDVPMANAPEEEVAEDMIEGPVGAEEAEQAPSLPAQNAADNATGQQYDLPDKVEQVPAAVKFKLKSDMKVCVAFDYMRVKVGDIAEMQHFTPALLRLFAEEEKRKAEEAAAATEKVAMVKKGKQGKQGKHVKKEDRKQKRDM